MPPILLSSYDSGRITTVSLYATSDQAQIQREYDVSLEAGTTHIHLLNLPTDVEEDSLQVEAFSQDAQGSAMILDVVLLPIGIGSGEESKPSTELVESRSKLELKRRALDALFSNQSILSSYVNGVSPAHTSAQDLTAILSLNALKTVEFAEKRMHLEVEIADLEQAVDRLEMRGDDGEGPTSQRAKDRRAGLRQRTVRVLVEAGSAAYSKEKQVQMKIKLTYLVRGAGWSPVYDIRARSPSSSTSEKSRADTAVIINYGASIINGTSEPWESVTLLLSTASPTRNTEIPSLATYRIGLPSPNPPPPPCPQPRASFGGAAPMAYAMAAPGNRMLKRSAIVHREEDGDRGGFDVQAVGRGASVSAGSSVVLRVEGAISAESDSASHRVSLCDLTLAAEYIFVSVPTVSPTAFLQATVKNTSSFPLLPGPTSIHLDGSFVARGRMASIMPGEEFKLSLGVDAAVKVVAGPEEKFRKTQGGLFGGETLKESWSQTTKFENTKASPISLLILSRYPVSDDSKITVKLTSPSSLPASDSDGRGVTRHSDSGDKGNGLIEWRGTVAAGARRAWTIGWEVEGTGWIVKS